MNIYEYCAKKLRELHGGSEESGEVTRQTVIPWAKLQADTTITAEESK